MTARRSAVDELEARLAVEPASGTFDPTAIADQPEPVRRLLTHAIAPGTPLALAARIRMRGSIKLGPRWFPFRATEVLAPHRGFVWRARVAGVVTGSDHGSGDHAGLDWRLLGTVPVMRAGGPDVVRSAAGRAAGEAVWLPTALLPSTGTRWKVVDERHVVATFGAAGAGPVEIRIRVGPDGSVEAVTMARWGDPEATGTWGLHPFGLEVTGEASLGGLTVAAAGRVGWHHGTDRWPEGEFFRFEVTAVEPVGVVAEP